MNSIPPIGNNPYNPTSAANTPPPAQAGALDNDYDVVQAVNEAWEAGKAYQQNPSEMNTKLFIQAINNLNTALNKAIAQFGPPSSSNPASQALYNQLNMPIDGINNTLANICSLVPISDNAVQWLNGQNSTGPSQVNDMVSLLAQNWKSTSGSDQDSNNAQVQQDLEKLQSDLEAQNGPSVANDINALMKDLQKINGDGYLTIVSTFLQTPIDTAGDTLASLAQGQQVTNLMTALNTISGTGTVGSDLLYTLQYSLYEEFDVGSAPTQPGPIPTNPVFPTPPAPPNTLDGNYNVVEAANAVWEAGKACQSNPSVLNIQLFIQAVKNLNAALAAAINANGWPSSSNPATAALYTQLNQVLDPNGETLASVCSETPITSGTIQWLQNSNSTGPAEINEMVKLVGANWPSTSGSAKDAGDIKVKNDLQTLQSDIAAYQRSSTPQNAQAIAKDIATLQTDLQSIKGDGYLSNMEAYLNTTFDASLVTLSSLAALVNGNPSSQNLQTFMTELSAPSGSKTLLGDLSYMTQYSLYEEFGVGSQP